MNDYRTILKQVGLVLVCIGILDIGLMIYCIVNGMGYSSSFNIFAVIAGLLLMRGGLKTAHYAGFYGTFFVSGGITFFIVLPFFVPISLVMTELSLYPIKYGGEYFITLCFLIILVWVCKKLNNPSVLSAIAEQNPRLANSWRKPKLGIFLGVLLVLTLGIILHFSLHGKTADEAIAKAKQKVGDGYQFYVSSFKASSYGGTTHVKADVTAYNQTEIKDIIIEWDE